MVTSSSVAQRLSRSNFPTVSLWNSSISEAIIHGHSHKALVIFRQMKRNGFEPDAYTFPLLAKACSKLCHVGSAKTVHAHVAKSPFRCDAFALTAVADAYLKCKALGDAQKMFDRMPERDTAAWNSMIVGLSQSGQTEGVFSLFRRMQNEGIQPDSITIVGLAQASSNSRNLELLKAVRSLGIRSGLDGDILVCNTWICAYGKCGDLCLAESVFDGIECRLRTVVSWNSMIEAYSSFGRFLDALECYKRLLLKGFRPDSGTMVSLISSCDRPREQIRGASIHSHATQLGFDLDVSVVNTLMSMYSKCDDLTSARDLFDAMARRSSVSWNVMIAGYTEKGDLDEALRQFRSMEFAGANPDSVTLISLVSGCTRTGALELGKQIEEYALSNGTKDDIVLRNALIDMYTKCGSINDARRIFQAIPKTERTIVSWSAMISGYALNGKVEEALNLFTSMPKTGLKPNHVTFLAALQACVHAGLLQKGLEILDSMTVLYNITPGLDHYSCIVDLFGRTGKISEALEFIQSMPVKPDAGVWSSLLNACKIHQDVKVAELAYGRVLDLDPMISVPYVEMANLYASEKKWDGVAAVRKMMKRNNVRKSQGQSVVVVNGKPRAFCVDDRNGIEGLCVYAVLDSLMLHLRRQKYFGELEGLFMHESA